MASRRQLYKSHPLYILLNPHLQHTLNVNHQHTFLKDRKGRPGRYGELFAGDYDSMTQCMANGMTSFNFKESAFPDDIAKREVDNPDLFFRIGMMAFCCGMPSRASARNMSIYITNLKQMLLKTMKFRHGQMISTHGIAAEFPGFLLDLDPGRS